MTVAAIVLLAAAAPMVRMATDAALRIDGDDLRLGGALYKSEQGSYLETLNERGERPGADNAINFRFVRSCKTVLGAGRSTLMVDPLGKGVDYACDLTAHQPLSMHAFGLVLELRADVFAGQGWSADSTNGTIPKEPIHTKMGGGSTRTFVVNMKGGRRWTLTFAKPVEFIVLDTRRQWRNEIEVRFFPEPNLKLAIGQGRRIGCKVTPSDGKALTAIRDFHSINPGGDWTKLNETAGIRPASALDFSRSPYRHLPAGANGWLTATTNGQFRFGRKADVPQRFFGCRARSEFLFADKQKSAAYAKLLTRYGYNSIRVNFRDSQLVKSGPKGLQFNPEVSVKLDQLVVTAARSGLYTFMDATCPWPWTWTDLGAVAPGGHDPTPELAGAMGLCDMRALGAWKAMATAVYGRKNKVGSKTYPEDPAVPLVTLVNDFSPFSAWNELRTLPEIRAGYGRWLKSERQKNPKFMEDAVCEEMDLGIMPLGEKRAGALRRYLAERERSAVEEMRKQLKAFKSHALAGAAFGGKWYRDVAALRGDAGDFDCESFTFDSPRHFGERGTVPIRIDNLNPLLRPDCIPSNIEWHRRANRPQCIVAWSTPAPSSWRAPLGLLVGGWAATHGWDGLWRDGDLDDPMDAAIERAVWALFARGDLDERAEKEAFVIKNGALTVKSGRTVGGFSPDAKGQIKSGELLADLGGSRAAVWVTSLTAAPVASSKRLLLTHLTDMQRMGTQYADSHCDLMMRKGTGPVLVRSGTAKIDLAVEKASAFRVFALDPDGMRAAKIPVGANDGHLVFTCEVKGTKGAQYLYELVRD